MLRKHKPDQDRQVKLWTTYSDIHDPNKCTKAVRCFFVECWRWWCGMGMSTFFPNSCSNVLPNIIKSLFTLSHTWFIAISQDLLTEENTFQVAGSEMLCGRGFNAWNALDVWITEDSDLRTARLWVFRSQVFNPWTTWYICDIYTWHINSMYNELLTVYGDLRTAGPQVLCGRGF